MSQTPAIRQPSQGLATFSGRLDAVTDAIEALQAQVTAIANDLHAFAIEAARSEPLAAIAPESNWHELLEVRKGDLVWYSGAGEWLSVDEIAYDVDLRDQVVKVTLDLGDGRIVTGRPDDHVRVADEALAAQVDAFLDNMHDAREDVSL